MMSRRKRRPPRPVSPRPRPRLLAAEKDLHQAQTRLAKAVIQSPLDGVVSSRNINVGDLVGEPGATRIIFQIVDNRLLDLTVTVPSTEMGRLRLGQPLTFITDAFPEKPFSGQIKFINPTVNEADRSVKVIAEVPNSDGNPESRAFCQRPDHHRTAPEDIANPPIGLALLGCRGQKRGGLCSPTGTWPPQNHSDRKCFRRLGGGGLRITKRGTRSSPGEGSMSKTAIGSRSPG